MNNPNAIEACEQAIVSALDLHADDIQALAQRLDAGDEQLSELADDKADELKGVLGAKLANDVSYLESDSMIDRAEAWVAENVSNSTSSRRIAAVFALLGEKEARTLFASTDG